MKKLLFIIFLFALIGCKTKQTLEQEKVQTTSSISKSTMVDDSSIITIVYDMLDQNETTREITPPGANETANTPKPPNKNRHRKGKIRDIRQYCRKYIPKITKKSNKTR